MFACGWVGCGRPPQAFPYSDEIFTTVVVVGSSTELLQWPKKAEASASVGKKQGKKKKHKSAAQKAYENKSDKYAKPDAKEGGGS